MAGAVVIQAQDNLPHRGVLPEKHRQGAVIQAAQGKCIAVESPVQGTVTHEVDGSLKHIHGPAVRDIRQAEADGFVAASGVAFETAAVPVIGAPQAGEGSLAVPVVADKHAVVMLGILIQQTSVDKAPDYLGRNAPLFQIGIDTARICILGWQRKGGRWLWNL